MYLCTGASLLVSLGMTDNFDDGIGLLKGLLKSDLPLKYFKGILEGQGVSSEMTEQLCNFTSFSDPKNYSVDQESHLTIQNYHKLPLAKTNSLTLIFTTKEGYIEDIEALEIVG